MGKNKKENKKVVPDDDVEEDEEDEDFVAEDSEQEGDGEEDDDDEDEIVVVTQKKQQNGKKNAGVNRKKGGDKASLPSGHHNKRNKPVPESQPPAPKGKTVITDSPFEQANQNQVNISFRHVFNPTKQIGPILLDMAAIIRNALEDANLTSYNEGTKKYESYDAELLNWFVCLMTLCSQVQNSLPYPLAVDLKLPTTSKTYLHPEKLNDLTPEDRKKARELNSCHFEIAENMFPTPMSDTFWSYFAKAALYEKIGKYGGLISGSQSMWGKSPLKMESGEWLVDADCAGVAALNGRTNNGVRVSKDNKGKVYVTDAMKSMVDENWSKTHKTWGMLNTFKIDKASDLKARIFRRDRFSKTETEMNSKDYWTDISGTTSSNMDANTILNKNHVISWACRLYLGAALTSDV